MRCVLLLLPLPLLSLTCHSLSQKQETINRLLNKQVGRTSSASSGKKGGGGGGGRQKSKLNKSVTADGEGGEGEGEEEEVLSAAAAKAAAIEEERARRALIKPTVSRWISSIRPPAPPASNADADPSAPPPAPLEPTFHLSYSLAEGRAVDFSASLPPPAAKKARQAPVSRRFGEEEKREMRRGNEEGWRRVMFRA